MNHPVFILLAVVAIVLIYEVVTHKISIATLQAKLEAGIADVKGQLGLVHAAALSPVLVAPAPQAPNATSAASTAVASTTTAAPAAAAPAAPVNPFIAWFQQGKDMAWCIEFGLGGVAPTDAQWAQAIAAGYVKDSGPQPGAASPVIDWTPDTLDYSVVRDQNGILTGPVKKTITGCPSSVTVKTIAPPNAVLKTPYTLTVNGVARKEEVAVATNMLTVQGPIVVVEIDQAADSVVDLWIG